MKIEIEIFIVKEVKILRERRSIMTLREFIRENRKELDECIANALGEEKNPIANDKERRLWILNDESLYRWARQCGVKI